VITLDNITETFWSAPLSDLKKGYLYEPPSGEFVCLICGARFARGRIYNYEDLLFEAEKMAQVHLEVAHSSMFEYLIGMDKKYTGLTEHQKSLVSLFHQGLNDKEIAARMDGVSLSTVRNHRFALREKMKQAKVFLAIMELLEAKMQSDTNDKFIEVPRSARMVDERFAITEAENEEIIKRYFPQGPDGPISEFPAKEKRKVIIIKQLAKRFEPGRMYTEREVNAVLEAAYHDYVTLRRYLIEYGFLDRLPDGSSYWLNEK
jgi:DNA-binding CsgD family transcriptional regulator